MLGDNTGDGLEGGHIGGAASTDTTVLGRGVDSDEDDIGSSNALGNGGGEEEVGGTGRDGQLVAGVVDVAQDGGLAGTITGDTNNVVQARLVDGRVVRVPATDAVLVAVDDGDLDVGVLEGNDGSGRST